MAGDCDYIFFLGDGITSLGSMLANKNFRGVTGNCDPSRNLANGRECVIEVDGVKILLCHGDRYGVKSGLTSLYMRAKEENCKLVFYGHTHTPSIEEYDGITFVCPGSTHPYMSNRPTYALTVIKDGKMNTIIADL